MANPAVSASSSSDSLDATSRGARTSHERAVDDPREQRRWETIAESERFQTLVRARRRFVIPATLFFVVYYFALPILVGWAPTLMQRKVLGPLNVAYLFALSQFVMAWVIAALYVRAAHRFDTMSSSIARGDDR